jgi:negative regulator of sigma E activity
MPDMPNQNDYRNNELAEKLSALVDGETSGSAQPESEVANTEAEIDRLLEQFCYDDRSKRAWQSYHLTRDVVQKDYHSALPSGFCASISARLESEETYSMSFDDSGAHVPPQHAAYTERRLYEPKRREPSSREPSSRDYSSHRHGDDNVVPFGRRSSSAASSELSALTQSNRRWKSVAALGMAASVALATVAALQLFNRPQSDPAAGPEIARLAPGSSTVEPLALTGGVVPAVLTGGGTHWRDSGKQGHALKVEQQLNSYLTNHLEDAAMGKVKGMISHSRVVGYDSSVLRSESF